MNDRDANATSDMPGEPGGDASEGAFTVGALREGPGTRIGPYRILQLLGEGGFGSVFMAEQERPVVRKVAVKIIKLGMDTRQVVARFEQERQTLAILDHPNIARVFDAGATEAGRPYFVMELCTGEPIDDYCDRHNLSIQGRLALFAEVCNAVQHAHSKGIIHRDIKPSNVLVSSQGGRAIAKVIDFGIAKATSGRMTEMTVFTEHRQLIGTPEYMSPEQAEGSLDIDTRTDVYSLGVMLYELLTGSTPFSTKELRAAAYAEIQRIIREVDPPNPSTRLSQNTETLANVASHRRTAAKKLGTMVRGELDWIVMKAIEKDRTRRYETASGLQKDVERYLAGEAVLAAPPRASYRLRKLVSRNKGVFGAAAAVAVALATGMGAFAWQAETVRKQRDEAVQARGAEAEQRQAAEEQRAMAHEQRDRAVRAEAEAKQRAEDLRQVSDFQAEMLSQVDATRSGELLAADVIARHRDAVVGLGVAIGDLEVRERAFRDEWAMVNATDVAKELIDRTILRPAADAIESKFADQPLVAAYLRQTLATRYWELGMFDAALPLQTEAMDTRRSELGNDAVETLSSVTSMGQLLRSMGKLADAERYSREALDARRRLLGNEHSHTLDSVSNVGQVLRSMGKLAEAEPFYREALEGRRRTLGAGNERTLSSMNNMGSLLHDMGKLQEAEGYFREALEGERRTMGNEHPRTLSSIGNLGALMQEMGRLAEAEPFYREALDTQRRVLGESHPDTLISIGNLGILLQYQGKLDAAEPLLREALAKQREVLGREHPRTLVAMNNMGMLMYSRKDYAAAETMFEEALAARRRLQGDEHPETMKLIQNLGVLLQAAGKLDEAEPYFREGLALRRRVLGDEHPGTLNSINSMGNFARARGKLEEAEAYYREAVTGRVKVLGPAHPGAMASMTSLAEVLAEEGKPAELVAVMEPLLPRIRESVTEPNRGRFAKLLVLVGEAEGAGGAYAKAETLMLEATAMMRLGEGEVDAETRSTVRRIAALYAAWQKADPRAGAGVKGAAWETKWAERLGVAPE